MNKIKYSILLLIFLITTAGCASAKKVTYVGVGSLIGAGAGYAIDRNGKDAAIGGLVGGTTGAIVADFQEKKENKKYKLGFDQGYTQARLEIAEKYWDQNTGKKEESINSKSFQRIKIPKKEVNDVVYESHYETLEVYQ